MLGSQGINIIARTGLRRTGNSCRGALLQCRFLSDPEGPRQRQQKVKKKVKKAKETGGRSKELELILASLDAPERKEGPISEEEKARRYEIGRNYVIGRFKRHNEIDHDLTCKLHMKHHAIKMLPRNSKIKEEALKISDEMPPPWRDFPTWTPPIPGFDPSEFVEKES